MEKVFTEPMEAIAKAAAFELARVIGAKKGSVNSTVSKIGRNVKQFGCDAAVSESSLSDSVPLLNERYLKPMVCNLAASVPIGSNFGVLETSRGHQSAVASTLSSSVRATAAWRTDPIVNDDGEVTGYQPRQPVLRLDILVISP